MSWDISLIENEEIVQVPAFNMGSILYYTEQGRVDAEMTVTWNYKKFYYDTIDVNDGIRWLNGKKAKDTIEKLTKAVEILGIEPSASYWSATKGNAGTILAKLLEWATLHPEASWEVE